MPTRLERWMRSKLRAIDRLHAEQLRALGGPVARRAGAVLLAGEHDRGRALRDVLHRRIVDGHLLAGRLEQGEATFHARAVRRWAAASGS